MVFSFCRILSTNTGCDKLVFDQAEPFLTTRLFCKVKDLENNE